MKYKLIIFDFDGTLGDTRANIIMTMKETLRRKGLPMVSDESIGATIGLPLEESFLQLFPDLSEKEMLGCAALYREIFEEKRRVLIPTLFPGAKETLQALTEMGCTLSVASSRRSPSLSSFLNDMGIARYFSYVLGADNVAKAKPDPEPVLKTLRDLGFSAEETLVVGDMPVDILMGKRAGAAGCGVTYGNSSREELLSSGADIIADSLPELLLSLGVRPGSE